MYRRACVYTQSFRLGNSKIEREWRHCKAKHRDDKGTRFLSSFHLFRRREAVVVTPPTSAKHDGLWWPTIFLSHRLFDRHRSGRCRMISNMQVHCVQVHVYRGVKTFQADQIIFSQTLSSPFFIFVFLSPSFFSLPYSSVESSTSIKFWADFLVKC